MTQFTERQKNIIEASIKLISEKGIQQLTIKNISKKLGISEPAIYRHFESKLDILLAILANFKNNAQEIVQQNRSIESSAFDQIEMRFAAHLKQFVLSPAIAAVVFSEEIFQNDKKLAKEVAAIMQLNQEAVSMLVEKGQRKNEIRTDIPGEQISLIIMGSLRLLVTKWRLSDYSFNLEQEGAALWQSIKKLIER